MYTLLKNDTIITGPRIWSAPVFKYFLKEQCDITEDLVEPPLNSFDYGNGIKIVPTTINASPEYNALFEVLAGPYYSFDANGLHVGNMIKQDLPVEDVKINMKSIVASNRWVKETTPIEMTINGKDVVVYTDRESRNLFVQALLLAGDTFSAEWKFSNGFQLINKSDLQQIVNNLSTHVQTCFDEESQKVAEIESKTTIEELKLVQL